MNTQVKVKEETSPSVLWQWRDRYGTFHHPSHLETRHLFHVVRMIWDHSMPEEMQTHFPKRYYFSEFYSQEYMTTALYVCFPILINRPDLKEWMAFELERMYNFLRSKDPRIPAPLLRLPK